jgi:hypothetical protein
MTEPVLLDNDAALKIACYSLVDEMLASTTIGDCPPAILGVGRFVIRGRLAKANNIADPERASEAFERLLEKISLVEPDSTELAIAADLESEANRRDLELDGGESQLLAIMTNRGWPLLITGDKRAIAAMAVVGPGEAQGKVACLEQLVAQLVRELGWSVVRLLVCAEPAIDRALTVCFGCSGSGPGEEGVLSGLASYIGHLAKAAPGMLFEGEVLVERPT